MEPGAILDYSEVSGDGGGIEACCGVIQVNWVAGLFCVSHICALGLG